MDRGPHGGAEAGAKCRKMPAIGAVCQHTMDDISRGSATAELDREFKVQQRFNQVEPGGDETSAHTGRLGFGKTVEINHAVQTIEGGEPCCRLHLEISENVIFDDR